MLTRPENNHRNMRHIMVVLIVMISPIASHGQIESWTTEILVAVENTRTLEPHDYLNRSYARSPHQITGFDIYSLKNTEASVQKNYKKRFIILSLISLPLIGLSYIASDSGNRELAIGLATGAVVTSSFGLVYAIKDYKQKRVNE
mgnify:CR=1 FL=1